MRNTLLCEPLRDAGLSETASSVPARRSLQGSGVDAENNRGRPRARALRLAPAHGAFRQVIRPARSLPRRLSPVLRSDLKLAVGVCAALCAGVLALGLLAVSLMGSGSGPLSVLQGAVSGAARLASLNGDDRRPQTHRPPVVASATPAPSPRRATVGGLRPIGDRGPATAMTAVRGKRRSARSGNRRRTRSASRHVASVRTPASGRPSATATPAPVTTGAAPAAAQAPSSSSPSAQSADPVARAERAPQPASSGRHAGGNRGGAKRAGTPPASGDRGGSQSATTNAAPRAEPPRGPGNNRRGSGQRTHGNGQGAHRNGRGSAPVTPAPASPPPANAPAAPAAEPGNHGPGQGPAREEGNGKGNGRGNGKPGK